MLLYSNKSFWRVVFEFRGSVVFKPLVFLTALALALISAALQVLIDNQSSFAPDLPHHYGMHALGGLVTFAVVFRSNLGWQRYWEAMTQMQFMYSKWADVFSQMHAFCTVTIDQTADGKGGTEAEAKIRRIRTRLASVENNFAMLSAIAADRLIHGDTHRMERRASVASWSQQVVLRRELRVGKDLTGAKELPLFVTLGTSAGSFGSPVSVNQSLASSWKPTYIVSRKPSRRVLDLLAQSSDRVNVVMYWVIHDLAKAQKDLDISPPIQSRMYQELSNGMLGFNNCLKIADVPFPFPYAQLLSVLIVMFSAFVPVYIVVFTKSMTAGPILTFLITIGLWGLNEVAKELENPFGLDVNHISLVDFHARFVDALADIQLAHEAKELTDGEVDKEMNGEPILSSKEETEDQLAHPCFAPDQDGTEKNTEAAVPNRDGEVVVSERAGQLITPVSNDQVMEPERAVEPPRRTFHVTSPSRPHAKIHHSVPEKSVGVQSSDAAHSPQTIDVFSRDL